MFGACEDHNDHRDEIDTSAQVNLVQADTDRDEELASIMDQLAISDFDPVSTEVDTE